MNGPVGKMPRLGFGTWGRTGAEGVRAIEFALRTGYRHLDTAQSYDTEREVGEAVAASGLPRADLWITTKVAPRNFGPGRLVPSIEGSLREMRLDHVDLALIHWPSPHEEVPLAVYLEQLAEARAAGLVTHVGVSNFTTGLLAQALSILGPGVILTNQIELNPLFQNSRVAGFCAANDIVTTCYQPLAQGRVNRNPVLQRIARRHGAEPTQVALAWELAMGHAAIPTSSKPERIAANFRARELVLSDGDMRDIAAITPSARSIDPDGSPDWD